MINITLGECVECVKNHEYSDRKYPRRSVNKIFVKQDSKIRKRNANGLLIETKLKINKLGAYESRRKNLENTNYCFSSRFLILSAALGSSYLVTRLT
jgi:hypothetical protein